MLISSGGPARRSLIDALVAVAVQTVLALLIAGSRSWTGVGDTDIYFRYATLIRAGQVPYRDFLVEYPPLAIPIFVVPAAIARGVVAYKVAFAGEMLVCNAVAVLLVARWIERREGRDRVAIRLAWYTLVVVFLSRLIVSRYDAAPMLVGFAATLWWSSGQGRLGGMAASVGTAMKLYPASAALVAMIGDGRPGRRGGGAIAFTATSIALALVWLAVGGFAGVTESIRYHSGRGFEYGSLYSGAQMLAAKLLGVTITIARDHSSFSTTTPWSASLARWVFPIQGAAILAVAWVFARRGSREGIRYQAAAVLAFIATGKVFSPQFLIWLIPYLAVLEGPIARRARWLFLAVAAATVGAPGLFGFLPRTSLGVILAYNGRNVLVVWLLILLVRGPLAPRLDAGREAGETTG